MSTETVLLLIVIALIIFAAPAWPYSKSWGYRPTSVLAVLLAAFLIWAIAGDRPLFRRTMGERMKSAGQDMSDSIRHAVDR